MSGSNDGPSFVDERFRAELKAYAMALTRSLDEAEDLVQDALLKALDAEGFPTEREAAKRYAFRILRNLHIDALRRFRVRAEYSTVQKRSLDEASPMSGTAESRLIVRDVFAGLSSERREVLFLVDVLGFTYAEAAEAISVAQGTVMSRLSRARAEMARLMDDDVGSPGVAPARRRS